MKMVLIVLLALLSASILDEAVAAQAAITSSTQSNNAPSQALMQKITQAMAQPTLQARIQAISTVLAQTSNETFGHELQNAFATAIQKLYESRLEEQGAATSATHKKTLVSKEKRKQAKSRKTPVTKKVDPGSKSGMTKSKDTKLKTKKANK